MTIVAMRMPPEIRAFIATPLLLGTIVPAICCGMAAAPLRSTPVGTPITIDCTISNERRFRRARPAFDRGEWPPAADRTRTAAQKGAEVPRFHLAQVNIGRLRAPLDDPIMEGFRSQLDPINALADCSPGFI